MTHDMVSGSLRTGRQSGQPAARLLLGLALMWGLLLPALAAAS